MPRSASGRRPGPATSLVAAAVERDRDERDGTYDVTVTAGDTVVATFVDAAASLGGAFW